MVGASVGFAIRFTDSFKMIPEVAMLYPALVSAGGTGIPTTSQSVGPTAAIYTLGIGFLWGNSR